MKGLLKVALIVGGLTAVAKLVTAKKSEWQGLTETQVREKLDSRLPSRIPEEKRAGVADKVVSKMRERGALREADEAIEPTPTEGGPTSSNSADAMVVDEPKDYGEPG